MVDYTTSGAGLPVGGSDSVTYSVLINSFDDLPNDLEAIADNGIIADGNGLPLASFDTRLPLSLCPSIELKKTVSSSGTCPGSESIEVGQDSTVTFCFEVINNGNTALTDIEIDDPRLGAQSPLVYGDTLPAGESWMITATVTATEAMKNTATVTGIPAYPNGDDISYLSDVTDTDTAQFAIAAMPTTLPPTASPTRTPIPNINVQKTVSYTEQGCLDGTAGEVVHVVPNTTIYWCLTVTNDGETPLDEVTLYDPQLGVNIENIVGEDSVVRARDLRRDLPVQSKDTQVRPTDVQERALKGQSSSALAYNHDNDPFTRQSRNLGVVDICKDADYDPRFVLLDENCGASTAFRFSCFKNYIFLKRQR